MLRLARRSGESASARASMMISPLKMPAEELESYIASHAQFAEHCPPDA